MALVEAQAAGLPVVAGTSPGVASVVGDGETGRLVPQGDPGAFSEAVRALLDPPRRAAGGAAARRNVVERHDIGAAAAALDRLLGETRRRFHAAQAATPPFERAG